MADKKIGVKITYQTENSLTAWVSPYLDASFEDILEGFYGLCVAHGWHPETVIAGMEEFARERSFERPDKK